MFVDTARCPGLCPVRRRPPPFTAVRAPPLTCPVNPYERPRTAMRTVAARTQKLRGDVLTAGPQPLSPQLAAGGVAVRRELPRKGGDAEPLACGVEAVGRRQPLHAAASRSPSPLSARSALSVSRSARALTGTSTTARQGRAAGTCAPTPRAAMDTASPSAGITKGRHPRRVAAPLRRRSIRHIDGLPPRSQRNSPTPSSLRS